MQEEKLQIHIKTVEGKTLTIKMHRSERVKKLKWLIQQKDGTEVDSQRIFFKGKELENTRQLSDYSMNSGSQDDRDEESQKAPAGQDQLCLTLLETGREELVQLLRGAGKLDDTKLQIHGGKMYLVLEAYKHKLQPPPQVPAGR